LAVVAVVGALVAPLAACGVFRSEPELDRQEMVRQMLDHLQAKYGKPFTLYIAGWPSKMNGLNPENIFFGVYPEGGIPRDHFLVKPDMSGAETVFHDGYTGILIRPIYEEKAQAIASRYFPGSIIQTDSLGTNGTFPDNFDAATTFDQFKAHADQDYEVNFSLYIPLSDGLDGAAVSAMLPNFQRDLSTVAGRGYLFAAACLPDVFEEKVVAYLSDDPENRFRGSPIAGGYIQFRSTTRWES
jgi:hypothetical protein